MHVHPCTVIWDLERSVHHLQIKHKGSILHKYLYFATLILLTIIFPFPQHELISAKKAKIWELVGEVEEAELGGEAVVRPQHTVQVVHPLFFKFCAEILFKKILLFFHLSFLLLLFSSCQTILLRRKLPNYKTRKRGTLTLYRAGWRLGAFQLNLKRRHGDC